MAIGSGEVTRRDGILVLITVAFLGLGALYWVKPHADKDAALADLRGRVERLERMNQRARADLASGGVDQLKAEADGYAEMLRALRQLVPQSNEVPTLLEQVSTAARREGLEIGGIQPKEIIQGPEFDTYQYSITVTGGYHAIARFLSNVGSLARVITPVDLDLRNKEAPSGTTETSRANTAGVTATFVLRTYVARTEALLASAAPGAN
jgi:type IV pilus assembly protein PilO